MPSSTRRRLLTGVGVLLGTAGCTDKNQPSTGATTGRSRTTRRTQTTYPPQTDRPGWVGLEVENNDDETREVSVVVTADDEELFARTLTLRPQSEPEFNSVVPIPESGDRRVHVAAELPDGSEVADGTDGSEGTDGSDDAVTRSASATVTVSADAEYQRLFVTIDRRGDLQLTQGTEPSEPIRTTTHE